MPTEILHSRRKIVSRSRRVNLYIDGGRHVFTAFLDRDPVLAGIGNRQRKRHLHFAGYLEIALKDPDRLTLRVSNPDLNESGLVDQPGVFVEESNTQRQRF